LTQGGDYEAFFLSKIKKVKKELKGVKKEYLQIHTDEGKFDINKDFYKGELILLDDI